MPAMEYMDLTMPHGGPTITATQQERAVQVWIKGKLSVNRLKDQLVLATGLEHALVSRAAGRLLQELRGAGHLQWSKHRKLWIQGG